MPPVTIHGVNHAALSEQRVGGEDEISLLSPCPFFSDLEQPKGNHD